MNERSRYKCEETFYAINGELYRKGRIITESEFNALPEMYQEFFTYIVISGTPKPTNYDNSINEDDFSIGSSISTDFDWDNPSSSSSSDDSSDFGGFDGGSFGGGGDGGDW